MSRLRILYYIPEHTDAIGIHHELTTNLATYLNNKGGVEVIVSSDKRSLPKPADFDLVHFFGCWSNTACQLAAKAYRQLTPYIITPLGMLQPWEYARHHKTPLFSRQHLFTTRAAAVHVCGKLEAETFARLGWNKRTCLIKNPVLTSQISYDEATDQLTALYRKVLDTNVQLILKEETRRLIGSLLQTGLDTEVLRDAERVKHINGQIHSLTAEEWRRAWIYISDEHCEDIIKEALTRLQIEQAVVDVPAIDRFPTKKQAYREGHLTDGALLSRNLLLRNKVKDSFATRGETEQHVCLQLLNLHYELGHHTAPLLHLCDLYHTMRFTDMDEDMVKDMVHELGIDEFAERLMAVMHDFLGLTEGFMPFKARVGKQARLLLTALTKFGTYQ